MGLSLNLTSNLPTGIEPTMFEQALKAVQQEFGEDFQGQVNLALVDQPTAHELNLKFADNDYATDVLSFDYFEGESARPAATDERAEVIICLPIAQQQAKEYGIKLADELALLFVHGLLHVLGHDHHDKDQQASFATRQNAIMDMLTDSYRDIFA